MKYIKYTIKTVKDAEDIIAALLTDLDVEGVEIEDASLPDDIRKNGTFYDVLNNLSAHIEKQLKNE